MLVLIINPLSSGEKLWTNIVLCANREFIRESKRGIFGPWTDQSHGSLSQHSMVTQLMKENTVQKNAAEPSSRERATFNTAEV